MEVKLEGRQVDLGEPLRERIRSRLDTLDKRHGPITHARVSVEKKAHKNSSRAEVKAVVNVAGSTITASKSSSIVVSAVNETLDALAHGLRQQAEKRKDTH